MIKVDERAISKSKLQDMDRIARINREIADIEDSIQVLRKEEYELWKKNDYKFEITE